LAWGKFRAVLSPGHQREGSAFSVETPNTLAGVKFSQPVIEVGYDPETDTTTIDAQTVDVIVTNLRTQRTELVLSGRRAVIQKDSISLNVGQQSSSPSNKSQLSPQPQPEEAPLPQLPQEGGQLPPGAAPVAQSALSGASPSNAQPPMQSNALRRGAFVPAQRAIRGATGSTVPMSVGVVGVQQPQPGEPGTTGPLRPGGLVPDPLFLFLCRETGRVTLKTGNAGLL
jgi:hypothetical protein